jgi:hypothetical protein
MTDEAQRRADRWNKRHAGKPAGKLGKDGYYWVTITYEGKRQRLRCDRVVWAMTTGAWPVGDIIHVNGDNGDDRFDNLRDSGAVQ